MGFLALRRNSADSLPDLVERAGMMRQKRFFKFVGFCGAFGLTVVWQGWRARDTRPYQRPPWDREWL
jgi:hypothetical protein